MIAALSVGSSPLDQTGGNIATRIESDPEFSPLPGLDGRSAQSCARRTLLFLALRVSVSPHRPMRRRPSNFVKDGHSSSLAAPLATLHRWITPSLFKANVAAARRSPTVF